MAANGEENSPNSNIRAAVAAARLHHFGQGQGVENTLHGSEHGTLNEAITSLENRVSTVAETISALFEEVNSIRDTLASSEVQDIIHTMREGFDGIKEQFNSLRATVETLVENNGKHGLANVEVKDDNPDVQIEEDNPPPADIDWEIPLDDDEESEILKKQRAEEAETCGVCHVKCSKKVLVLIPCGHYPFCAACVEQLCKKRDDITLFRRPDGWDDAKLFCPICQEPTPSFTALRKLRPYLDSVVEIN